METLWQDVRYAIRMLVKNPGFTLVVVLTLALGTGGNTVIFSVVNSVFLRPLPFPDSDKLLRVQDSMITPDGHRSAFASRGRSFTNLLDENQVFDSAVALEDQNLTLLGGDQPERVIVILRAGNWAGTLGIRPILGRDFSPQEEKEGSASRAALIGYGLWKRRFGGDASVIGKTLTLEDRTYTVVGVMPQGYRFPFDGEIWTPTTVDPNSRDHEYAIFARLKPGVTIDQARAKLNAIAERMKKEESADLPGFGLVAFPIRESLLENQESIPVALSALVGFFLLIACVNVANLLLARSITRRREMAIRAALGARRSRQIGQLLTESMVLSLVGSACGLLLAVWLGEYAKVLLPSNLSGQLGISNAGLDWRVLGFSAAISILAGVLSGTLPALSGARSDVQSSLNETGRGDVGSGKNRRLLGALVVSETAFALVLLAGAGLIIENFQRLSHRNLGFETANLTTLQLDVSPSRYVPGPQRTAFVSRTLEQVERVPGVVAAGALTENPLGGEDWVSPVQTESPDSSGTIGSVTINYTLATPGTFEAMRIPLRKGRLFTKQDDERSENVAVVSEKTAARLWPGVDPIGKRMRIARPNRPWVTVVGVVGNVHYHSVNANSEEVWYVPYAQQAAFPVARNLHLMVRTQGDPATVVHSIERAIWSVDASLAASGISVMDHYYSESLERERVGAVLILLFAGFGLILAALGVYGVLSFAVSQRTREIGVRMALGAQRGDILPLVLKRGMILTVVGVAIGSTAAMALNRVLSSLLAEVHGVEPGVFCAAAAILLGVALVASYLPARRASRMDPLVALRYE